MHGRCLPHENEKLVVEQAGVNRKNNQSENRKRKPSPSRSVDDRASPRESGAGSDDVCYNCNKNGHW